MANAFEQVISNIGAPGQAPESAAPQTQSAPETVSSKTENQSTTETQAPEAPQWPDLDKLERIRLDGKELPVKELRNSMLRYSDYTKKTQEVAEARKYAENFLADFSAVRANPSLFDKFKQIYPAHYVQQVEAWLNENQTGAVATPTDGQQTSANDELVNKVLKVIEQKFAPQFQELSQVTTSARQAEEKAIVQQLDNIHSKLQEKYPFADPELADFKIQTAKESGADINLNNLSKVYEGVYKRMHESIKTRLDQQQKSISEKQVKAGQKARDVVGGNGAIPAQPPKKYTKFSDITKDVLAQYDSK